MTDHCTRARSQLTLIITDHIEKRHLSHSINTMIQHDKPLLTVLQLVMLCHTCFTSLLLVELIDFSFDQHPQEHYLFYEKSLTIKKKNIYMQENIQTLHRMAGARWCCQTVHTLWHSAATDQFYSFKCENIKDMCVKLHKGMPFFDLH